MLDESAHAAAGLLGLAAITVSVDMPILLACLAGSVVIDLDHIPLLLGSRILQGPDPRPYPHAILSVLVIILLAGWLQGRARWVALVVAAAVALHLFRDLAEGGGAGVSLLWPVSRHSFAIPYWIYMGPMACAAAVALYRRRPVAFRAWLPR